MRDLFILFCVLNVVNVVLQTVKSLMTVKGSPFTAALTNAIAYFCYTYVLIYTSIDGLTMIQKASVVALSNLIGVLVVKLIEKKLKKDCLWQITTTFYTSDKNEIIQALDNENLTYSYNEYGKHIKFEIYSENQQTSQIVAKIVNRFNGKYFISENKGILY